MSTLMIMVLLLGNSGNVSAMSIPKVRIALSLPQKKAVSPCSDKVTSGSAQKLLKIPRETLTFAKTNVGRYSYNCRCAKHDLPESLNQKSSPTTSLPFGSKALKRHSVGRHKSNSRSRNGIHDRGNQEPSFNYPFGHYCSLLSQSKAKFI